MNVHLIMITTTDRKHLIFDSTLNLISQFGFHGTPMSQIAHAAGVATGTIYHYFESKDALIVELFIHLAEKMRADIFRLDTPSLPYKERFETIWINIFEHHIRHPEVLSFFEQFFSSPYLKLVYPEGSVSFQDEISTFLLQGIEKGYIKNLDITMISAAFMGTVTATAKRNIYGRFSFTREDILKMVGIIWDGLKNN